MCFRDLLSSLRRNSVDVTPAQVRWAINSGKVSRPPLDGSLRFDFSDVHLNDLIEYFRGLDDAKEASRCLAACERR